MIIIHLMFKKLWIKIPAIVCVHILAWNVTSIALPTRANFCAEHLFESYGSQRAENRSRFLNVSWLRYKTSNNPNPLVVDLGAYLRNNTILYNSWSAPTLYEHAVVRLRRDDTVEYDRKQFKLGKFLGAGNATHIFKLQDQKGVIRIPFLVSDLHGRFHPELSRIERILKFSKAVTENLPKKAGAVEILQKDQQARFMVVEEVQGSLKGDDLLRKVSVPGWKLALGETIVHPSRHSLKDLSDMTPEEREQLLQLIELMKENKEAWILENGSTAIHTANTRQYLWGKTIPDDTEREDPKPRWHVLDSGEDR